jgi:hypothetical protein
MPGWCSKAAGVQDFVFDASMFYFDWDEEKAKMGK